MFKRTLAVATLVVATIAGSMVLVPATANAAGPWFVATTGNDANSCLSAGSPCLTIQAAHTKASPGDTINVADGTYDERLVITKPVTITATNPGAVIINGATTPATAGITVAVGVPAGQTFTLTGAHVIGGSGQGFGGGVSAVTGTTVFTNDVVRNNGASTELGGGVFVWPGATFTMNGGELRNNTGGLGGGLFVTGQSTSTGPSPVTTPEGIANLNNVTINDNTANAGGTASLGNGGAIWNSGTLNVTGGQFNRNRTIISTGLTGIGGAIASLPLDAEDTPNTNLGGGTVIDNGLAASVLNATFGGGIASVGNILNAASAAGDVLTMDGVTVKNQRGGLGAGLFLSGKATITNSTITGNLANSVANLNGAGIYITKSLASGPDADVSLTNTTVSGNLASSLGGGIHATAGAKLVVTGGTIASNTAVNGAGVYSLTDTTINGTTVGPANAASFQGGGIYTTAKLTVTGATITGNTAANAVGGVFIIAPSVATVTGSTISNNSGAAGGGAAVSADASALFTDTSFTGNNATTSVGGGGLFNSGTTTVTGGTFSSNTAQGPGGAIYNGAPANKTAALVVVDATISGNTATGVAGTALGGGLFSGTVASTANSINRVTLSGVTMTGNTAQQGAAILEFINGAGTSARTHVDRSTIHANNTLNAASGAIAVFNGNSVSIMASTVTDNTQRNIVTQAVNLVSVSGSILSGTVNCNLAVLDGGRNLVSSNTGCALSLIAPKNNVVAAPNLAALANNGGPTQTRNPNPSSPAINKIAVSTATGQTNQVSAAAISLCAPGAKDQRGTTRPQGVASLCDVGSVEADLSAPTITGTSTLDYEINVGITPEAYLSTGVPTPAMQAATNVPAGLVFTPSGSGGTLTGTPTGPAGQSVMTLTSTNSEGSDTHLVTVRIHQAPQLIGPSAATFTVGQFGTTPAFTQTGGFPNASFSTTGDALPADVGVQDNGDGTAVITGTPPDGAGDVYNLTVVADNGTAPDAELPFVLTINEAPELTGDAAQTVGIGEAVDEDFESDGYPEATLSISGDTLPDGVTFTDNEDGTATIAGAPLDGEGDVYNVTITATNGVAPDATHAFALTVNEAPEIAGAADVLFVETVAGSTGYVTDGYPDAALSSVGTLPAGITFVDNGNGTATLGGTAGSTAAGVYNITITASNGIAPDDTLAVTITVQDHVAITTTSLPNGTVGTPYGAQVQIEGGMPTYVFSISGGSLPAGLSMSSSGAITGTPIGPNGTSTFTVQVTDGSSPTQSDTRVLSITIGQGPTSLITMPVLITATNILGIKINLGYVSANLRHGFPLVPFPGQTIVFKAGATTVCTGVTAANGTVVCAMDIIQTLLAILNGGVTAHYAGTPAWAPAQASAGLIGV